MTSKPLVKGPSVIGLIHCLRIEFAIEICVNVFWGDFGEFYDGGFLTWTIFHGEEHFPGAGADPGFL